MVEYALMLALIAMVSIFPVTRVGVEVRKVLVVSGERLAEMVGYALSEGGNPHDGGGTGNPHDPDGTGDPH